MHTLHTNIVTSYENKKKVNANMKTFKIKPVIGANTSLKTSLLSFHVCKTTNNLKW